MFGNETEVFGEYGNQHLVELKDETGHQTVVLAYLIDDGAGFCRLEKRFHL